MNMVDHFDVVIIGTGMAGRTAADACRAAGRTVAIIDSRPFGGTCALRGCDAKKVMVSVAEAVDFHNRMVGKGVPGRRINIDWSEMMAFKNTFTDPMPEAQAKIFERSGIAAYQGRAGFLSDTEIKVDGQVLEGKNFVIAAGAEPMDLGVPGAEFVMKSDDFLDMAELPRRIVFIGGGFISFEFAHIANLAGAETTIIDRASRPLTQFDADLVRDLVKASEAEGITVKTDRPVTAVEKNGTGLVVRVTGPNGTEETFQADLVVHGAGRAPQLGDLNLEIAGVEADRKGVKVNEYLQSVSNPAVYAAGDAADIGPQLTPVAGYEARIVADNIIGDKIRAYEAQAIPGIVYTVPPLGAVGLTEEEAGAKGIDYRTTRQDSSGWYNSRRLREHYGSYKIVIDNRSDRILGAHVFGPAAEELINLFTLAISEQTTAQAMKRVLFAYPTFSYDTRYML